MWGQPPTYGAGYCIGTRGPCINGSPEEQELVRSVVSLQGVAQVVGTLHVLWFVRAPSGKGDDVIDDGGQRVWHLRLATHLLAAELAPPTISFEDTLAIDRLDEGLVLPSPTGRPQFSASTGLRTRPRYVLGHPGVVNCDKDF